MSRSPPVRPAEPARAGSGNAPLTVAGIGASAGGLKALQQFVEAVPVDSGMAFVVILHLDPDRESRMSELLQDRARIPVMQVSESVTVEANNIYVIPPEYDLAFERDVLVLRERRERSDHAPVDLLFRTLADARGQDAVGVVLSGTGSDGTAGVRYIRQAGGTTVAQSPDEAEYDGMPTSAISTGLIDLVLPSGRIAAELIRLRRLPSRLEDGSAAPGDSASGLAQVLATLRSRTGHDFSQYKPSTMLRRLDRRLRFNDVSTLADYQPLLQSSGGECRALLQDLLISVSSFFRDPEAFEALASLMPALFEGRSATDTIRVWVVGCATGEEVYSLAMVLAEHAATLADPPRLQLFATDIDDHGYAWARAGLYPAASVAVIPPARLGRFFTKEAGGYRVAKSLRELVLFAGHNVLHDPPFSRIDLISCRNLFIYLQPSAQERVLETFHFSLNPRGHLFLGAAESVGDSGLFETVSPQRIFVRNESRTRTAPRFSAADPLPPAAGTSVALDGAGAVGAAGAPGQRFSYGAAHIRMLEQYAPASAVVDERLNVVHMSASASRFLSLGEGEPSHNLMTLARDDLRRALRPALHHAFEKGAPTTWQVLVGTAEGDRQIAVNVRPWTDGPGDSRFALIVFEDAGFAITTPVTDGAAAERVQDLDGFDLEEELRQTRDLLDSTMAAHDRTVAELQMVNEELLSINEEQKAATAELETGREEIQSVNEELTTINQEHQSTIEELKRTNGDLQNLIESTEIGTIFLDRSMRIRRFTPAAGAIFNFVASDLGRSLGHITHNLAYPELMTDVAGVLESQERVEREAVSTTGKSYVVRINAYRSLDGGRDGAVLTFFDNTAQHRVEEELREAKIVAESANLAKGTFLATLSHEFRTPLNAILGYAALLELDGALSEAQTQKVERIKVGSCHLAAMIDGILSFAKLDAGHEAVDPKAVDARSIAHEAGALVEPAALSRGLDFVVDTPDVPVELVTDVAKARQILVNLCGNAVKFTATGEVRLSVRRHGDAVIFAVSDTGIGIAPEHQARIFERFWQVDGASARPTGGMGIGLAAAREYARLLGGDVHVTSGQNRGTTFKLMLPGVYGSS